MKPPLFHVGQAVTLIGSTVIIDCTRFGTSFRPKVGEVYTVNWVGYILGREYHSIGCVEWPQDVVFEDNDFAPVGGAAAEAYAELLEALEPVTV